METIHTLYGNDIIYIFDATLVTINIPLVIIKDSAKKQTIENVLIKHYSENFESYVLSKLPTKNRHPHKILSLSESLALIQEKNYGVLSFTYDDIPYSVGLNHVFIDDTIYFHSAKKGFKLYSTKCRVSYFIVDDLGINEKCSTHNYASVMMLGTMHQVTNIQTKQEVMHQLLVTLTPSNSNEITESMMDDIVILALDIQYFHGKKHLLD